MPWIADLPLLGAPHELPSLAAGIKAFAVAYDRREPEPHRPSTIWFERVDGQVLGLATAQLGDHFALAVGTVNDLVTLDVARPALTIDWRPWSLGSCAIAVFMALCVDSQPNEDGHIIVRVGIRAMVQRGETIRDTENPHYVGDALVFTADDGRRFVVTSAPWGRINVLEDAASIDEALELGRLWGLQDYLQTHHSSGLGLPD